MNKYWEVNVELFNEENTKMINAFLLNLKSKKRKLDTIRRYRGVLQQFFLKCPVRFSSIKMDDINRWLAEQEKNRKKRTVRDYRKVLRSFYEFCVLENAMKASPLEEVSDERYWEVNEHLSNKENRKVINTFLVHLKNEGQKRERILFYRNVLQLFFMEFENPYSAVTLEAIENWFAKHQKKWSIKTVKTYSRVFPTFFDFCVENGHLENTPLKKKRWVSRADKYWEVQQPIVNQKNKDVINEFLLYLKTQNRTRKTIEETRILLQYFFRERRKHFSSITQDEIKQWIEKCLKNRRKKTVITYVGFLRSFFRFCTKKGYLKQSPVKYDWEWDDKKENYWVLTKKLANNENIEMINEYLANMKVMNLSEKTIGFHKWFLQKFFEERKEPFYQLTSEELIKWLSEQRKVLKLSTIRLRLGILSSFYKFCVEEGHMEQSPVKSRWYPRLPKPVPKYLEKDELAKIRQSAEKEELRNRLIFEFFLSSGCRINEIHLLDKDDVDLNNREAWVTGKGKKIRKIHFSDTCAVLMERYLESRMDNHPALFVSMRETRLGIRRIQEIVEEIGIKAQITDKLYPHRFRHTFATLLLTKGADLSFIADELGHKNIQTTMIYARLPKEKLKSLYRQYMG